MNDLMLVSGMEMSDSVEAEGETGGDAGGDGHDEGCGGVNDDLMLRSSG